MDQSDPTTEAELEFESLEDAPTPLHVIATVFPAVERSGRKLIDGGVSNNTPTADAIELGAERVYVLPTGSACDLPKPPHGALAMLPCAHLASADARRPHAPLPSGVHEHLPGSAIAA